MDTAQRPLISIALITYNHEKYIREAVEAAFAQTYSPLEIILSDDCSQDATFGIMQGMVAAYTGPHRVVLRKNIRNLGLIDHWNTVWSQTSGMLILNACGDDVSLPDRAELAYQAWRQHPKAGCYAFSADVIREAGFPSYQHPSNPKQAEAIEDWLWRYPSGAGATLVWQRRLLDMFGPITDRSAPEDMVLLARGWLAGGIAYHDDVSVRYRKHLGSAGSSSPPACMPSTPEDARRVLGKPQRYRVGFLQMVAQDLVTARSNQLISESDYRAWERARRHAHTYHAAMLGTLDDQYRIRAMAGLRLATCVRHLGRFSLRSLLSSIAAALFSPIGRLRFRRMVTRRRAWLATADR